MFHPDNNSGEDKYNAIFVDIQKTYEAGNEAGLIEIGLERGMNMDEFIENVDELSAHWTSKTEEIKKEIDYIKSTIIWVWNTTTDELTRQEMRPYMVNKIKERSGAGPFT